MAVLIALVFIGIVTAAMLRNTGSQSGASVGYGTMQTMAVTTKSGIVATESYVVENGNSTNVLKLITEALNPKQGTSQRPQPYLFENNGEKTEIGNSGQFFSSQLIIPNADTTNAYFKIRSGNKKKGRDMKTALAFYNVGNVKIDGKSIFFGTNAFFAGENGRFAHGNAGTRIVGHATFETGFKTQNGAPVEFVKDDNEEGSVYIKNYLEILNDKNVTFDVNVFVDGWTEINNNVPNADVFKGDVGFNGNFSAVNRTTKFSGDVWFNGDLKDRGGNYGNSVLDGNNKTNNFFYTDSVHMAKDAMGCNGCKETPKVMCVHNCPTNHMVQQSTQITNFSNMDYTYKKPNEINTDVILDALKMDPLVNRTEPDLALDASHIGAGKEFLSFTKQPPNGYGKYSINGDELDAFYKATYGQDEYKKYYTDDGHLLLHVDGSVRTEGGTFNEKVILKVEGSGAQIDESGKFYNSGPNASTLVYVGKNGILNNFGCGDNGNFRGLVYVDPENDETITFKWGQNSSIDGAVLLKGGRLTWNANGAAVTTIRRDKEVLNNFGFLVKDDSNKNEREATLVNPGGIKLTPLGYYFY